MPLTVAGDFAWPSNSCVQVDELIDALSSSPLILNFEGGFLDGCPEAAGVISDLKFNLFSATDAIDTLERMNVVAVGLANNHIGDYRGACARTVEILERAGISYFGLQGRPHADIQVDGADYRFVGVVSQLTEITRDEDGLTANIFEPDAVLRQIEEWRTYSQDLKIVVFVHWGYELARYPLPADRAWAHRAIQAGANYIIGHHPHVVQGIEQVGDGIIAYSLGNCVLPQVRYRDKHLGYCDPAVANQLAITLERDPSLIWSRYVVADQSIFADARERFSASDRIRDLTPFAGMTEECYRKWFREAKDSGAARIKRGHAVQWSYSGIWKWHSSGVFLYLRFRRFMRALLIRLGLHEPYNWKQ